MLKIVNDRAVQGVTITTGEIVDISAVLRNLATLGYTRVDRIEHGGELSLHGDIFDVMLGDTSVYLLEDRFPCSPRVSDNKYTRDVPCFRIMFFDNEVEAIKQINPDNFFTVKTVTNLYIPPQINGENFVTKHAKVYIQHAEIPVELCINRYATGVYLCKPLPAKLVLKEFTVDETQLTHFTTATPVGALVVHEKHGLGRYIGTKRMSIGNGTQNYLAIQYDRRAVIYVPQSQYNMVFNYHGPHRRLDSLSF